MKNLLKALTAVALVAAIVVVAFHQTSSVAKQESNRLIASAIGGDGTGPKATGGDGTNPKSNDRIEHDSRGGDGTGPKSRGGDGTNPKKGGDGTGPKATGGDGTGPKII